MNAEWKESCLAELGKLETQLKAAIEHIKSDGQMFEMFDIAVPDMPGRFRIGDFQIVDTSQIVCSVCGKTCASYIEIDFNTYCHTCATEWVKQQITKERMEKPH